MKITARLKVFETNSSSTHSMIIFNDDEYQEFTKGELFYISDAYLNDKLFLDKKLVTKSELLDSSDFKEYKETKLADDEDEEYDRDDPDLDDYLFDEFCTDNQIYTYDSFGDNDYEVDENTYTSKSGDLIHIMCYYGYN